MSATEAAAWWGAIIATLVLVWDIFKWKKIGPAISVTATPNMKTPRNIASHLKSKTYIVVEVTNTGDRSTTLTHLTGCYYQTAFQRFRKKSAYTFFVADTALDKPLPVVLEPGGRWLGAALQDEETERQIKEGYFYCGICHTSRKKPILQRVVIQKTSSDKWKFPNKISHNIE